MNPRDDFLSCLRMDAHDWTPTFIFDTSFGMSILNVPVSDIYRNGFDAELSARSISVGRGYLGHDGIVGATSCGDSRVFGADVQLFPDRPPMIRKNAFSDPMAIERHSPEEIDCDILEGIAESHILLRKMEPDAFMTGYTPTPFLLCAVLRGIEHFLMDTMSKNGYIEELLDFSQKVSEITTERICGTGSCDAIMLPGAYDNVGLFGLSILKKYCIPGLDSVYKMIQKNRLPAIFHPHGSLTEGEGIDALDLFLRIGFDCIYYGEDIDQRKMAELTEGRCSIMGGIDTASTIYLGPDERVVKDTEKVLDDTEGSDFIFTCSCSVDYGLDRERLKLMMDTVRRRCGGPGRD